MNILKGIRPLDYVLAAEMVALAVFIALENINAGASADIAQPVESHSALMIPVFVAAALPILWRRRNVVAAIIVSFVIVAASVPMFGWVTRCGFALPLSLAMAYAVARFATGRSQQAWGMVAVLALQVVTLVKDSSTGGLAALGLSVPLAAVCYLAGVLANSRSAAHVKPSSLEIESVHA